MKGKSLLRHSPKLAIALLALFSMASPAEAQEPRRFAVGSAYGCRLLGTLSKPVKFDNPSDLESPYKYVTAKGAKRGIEKDRKKLKDNLPPFKKLLAEYKKKGTLTGKKLNKLSNLSKKLAAAPPRYDSFL